MLRELCKFAVQRVFFLTKTCCESELFYDTENMISFDELLMAYSRKEMENQRLKVEVESLRHEIACLKGVSNEANPKEEAEKPKTTYASNPMTIAERVALFRSLFKGREDVFARRWHSKTSGKSGYQPVCTNEWNRSLCDKKKYKCDKCPNRNLKPLDYWDFYNHLRGNDTDGRDVIGVYAILEDNKCNFLCADFDDKSCKHGYKEDVLSYVSVCHKWDVPYSIERSRSGNGAHVWIFFSEPVEAWKARKLGTAILTEAMNSNGHMSFQSYDRFFPNQDKLPDGGFGNLVALPLQGQARKKSNSVFVDETFTAFDDQWGYLQDIGKVSGMQLDTLLQSHASVVDSSIDEFSKSSETKPWETPAVNLTPSDFPASIEIVKANMLYIPIKGTPTKLLNYLKRLASFKNPQFFVNLAMRLPVFNVPRIISCADILDDYIALPRGCEEKVMALLHEKNVRCNIVDKTNHGHAIKVQFNGQLRQDQQASVSELCSHTNGVIHATTAFGKTVAAIGIIARLKVNTLILVHTKALLDQWKGHLERFLTAEFPIEDQADKRGRKKPYSPFGTLDSRGSSLHGHVDIALLQSCVSDNEVKPFVEDYGMLIVDECHHVPAVNFEQVLKRVKAQYVYGLTATPIRKDGHQPIIFMQCGAIRFKVDAKQQMAMQDFSRHLIPRFTTFRIIGEDNPSYTLIAEKVAADKPRNETIVNDVCLSVEEGRTPMVLTTRKSHVETLADAISQRGYRVITLVGSDKTKEKREKIELLRSLPDTEPLVIVAIDKYVGEGFDYPRLDTLFMAMPISWHENVQQYVGRLHRDHEGKKDVKVYDYIDIHVAMCNTMYKRRMKGYRAAGYQVSNLFTSSASVPIANTVFSADNFEETLTADIDGAQESAVFALSDTYVNLQSPIYKHLPSVLVKGIRFAVVSRKGSVHDSLWQELGISPVVKDTLTIQAVIVDRKTVWYGDIDYLGKNHGDENAIRLKDQTLANDLLDVLYNNDYKTEQQ